MGKCMGSFSKDPVLGDVMKMPGFVLGLNTYNGRKEILAALKNHLSMTTPLITAHQFKLCFWTPIMWPVQSLAQRCQVVNKTISHTSVFYFCWKLNTLKNIGWKLWKPDSLSSQDMLLLLSLFVCLVIFLD